MLPPAHNRQITSKCSQYNKPGDNSKKKTWRHMLPPVQSRWITQIVNDTKDVASIVNRWITETQNTQVAASTKSLDNAKVIGKS